MSICYINHQYKDIKDAFVSVNDRGYNFGDGAYEALSTICDTLIDYNAHYDRLIRSLKQLHIEFPYSRESLALIIREVLRKNNALDKSVSIYLQVSRGVAERVHIVNKKLEPTLFINILNIVPSKLYELASPISLKSYENDRWSHCDIKSISLLGNVIPLLNLDKKFAEVVFINEDNIVTECSKSNIFMVDDNDILYTYPLDNQILGGITRDRIIKIAKEHNMILKEEKFSLDKLKSAKEIFISSSIRWVVPIKQIDNKIIANETVGNTTKKIFNHYCDWINSI